MGEYFYSSGYMSSEEIHSSFEDLGIRKHVILLASFALLFIFALLVPFKSKAAEIGDIGFVSGGDAYGTMDIESNPIQPYEGNTLSPAVSETAISSEENESISTVSDSDSVGSAFPTGTNLDMLGINPSMPEMVSSGTVIYPVYDSYEEFMESPLYVTRYENEVLKKLEFIQYAAAIMIALLFLLIFKKK